MNSIANPGISANVPATPAQPKPATTGDAHAAAGQAASPASPDGDSVQLTQSARAMMDAAASSSDVPVDAERVAQIREQIANGTYRVDAQRVADRLISMERQLG